MVVDLFHVYMHAFRRKQQSTYDAKMRTLSNNVAPYLTCFQIFSSTLEYFFNKNPYPSSDFVIVKVHKRGRIFLCFTRVNKCTSKLYSKTNILTTSSPFKSIFFFFLFIFFITITFLELASTASTCYFIYNTSWSYSMDKCSLFVGYKDKIL